MHDPSESPAEEIGPLPHPERRLSKTQLTMVVAPIVALVVANNIGNALFPTLINDQPVGLLALNSTNRYLIAVSHKVNSVAYVSVGTLRLLAPDPLFYILGYCYGQKLIVWLEQRTATYGTLVRQLEELFGRYGHALVVIMPNNPVCLLAGAAEMPIALFALLDIVGTIGRLGVMYWIGEQFQGTIDNVLAWVGDHRWQLLAVTIPLFVFTMWREFAGGTSEIAQLIEFEEELIDEGEVDDAG